MLTAEERGQLLNEKPKPMEIPPATNTPVQVNTATPPEVIIKTEPDAPDVVATKVPEQKALNFIKLPDCLKFDRFVIEIDFLCPPTSNKLFQL